MRLAGALDDWVHHIAKLLCVISAARDRLVGDKFALFFGFELIFCFILLH